MTNRANEVVWPAVLVLAVFLASGRPSLAAPDPGFSYDKAAHFLVFGLIATAVVRMDWFRRRGWAGALLAAALVAVYGGLDEIRQSLTPGRAVELADWLADMTGASFAALLYCGWPRYRAMLEWRPGRRRG